MANCVWDELGLRIAINCQCNALIEIQKSKISSEDFSVIGFSIAFFSCEEAALEVQMSVCLHQN